MKMVTSRREMLGLLAGSALVAIASRPRDASADEDIPALIRGITGSAQLKGGRIRLTIPELADTGFSVPVNIDVDSPMTANDFVKSLHLIAPRNPRPLIASFTLTPLMARATWSTRVRLGGSQEVVAIAMMSDGTYRAARANVVVSVSACIDGT